MTTGRFDSLRLSCHLALGLLLAPGLASGADLKQSLRSIFEQALTKAPASAATAPAPAGPADLRALLLATPYIWADNGSDLGTLTFAADGSGRATWSGEIHYWKVEAPDQLVITAMGTMYVIRLTYQPADGTFRGARDRTSQVQDGVRTVLRPKNPVRLPESSGGTNGLLAEYFDNRELRGPPRLTRVDPQINFDWSYDSPGPGIPVDNFGARWTGQLQPRYSEAYVFSGLRDNGLRLWVDGQLLVDLWDNGWGLYESKPITLQAGRRHTIKIDYYEDMGGTGISLKWRSASQAEELVPTALLFPATPPPSDPGTTPPTAEPGGKPGASGKLDRTQWFATRGSWNNRFGEGAAYDDSAIEIEGEIITLKADRTDQVAALYSRPIALKPGDLLVIRRSVFVHAANRKFEGSLTAFAVADPGVNPNKPPHEASLFYLGYRNFDYETDQNLFCLADGRTMPPGPGKFAGGTAPTTAPLWDQWFEEELRYDSGTGETVCLINGQERLRFRTAPLTQPYIKLLLHPYGWGTGHYIRMRNLSITTQRGPTGPGASIDLRALLLRTSYVWSDNGNVMGNLVFSADGTSRASWSSDIHYWKVEAPDQLVISAMGTTYVTRLAYQAADGSFSGARDRTSRVQDGVKTVLRPSTPPLPPPGGDSRPPGTIPESAAQSTFDQDAQGWNIVSLADNGPYDRPLGNTKPAHLASGGNPGGCLTATDPGPGNFYWEAPGSFLGDQRSRYGGTLRFDLTSEGGEEFDEADAVLIGAGLILLHDMPRNPSRSWTSFSIPLVESAWRKNSLKGQPPSREEFQRVLGGIQALRLRGEFRNGPEICAIDNVRLAGPGQP